MYQNILTNFKKASEVLREFESDITVEVNEIKVNLADMRYWW